MASWLRYEAGVIETLRHRLLAKGAGVYTGVYAQSVQSGAYH